MFEQRIRMDGSMNGDDDRDLVPKLGLGPGKWMDGGMYGMAFQYLL